MLIKLTSYVQNPDYDEANGLLLQNQMKELGCLVNSEEFLWVFPTLKSKQGNTAIKFRNGEILTMKETVDEIQALLKKTK